MTHATRVLAAALFAGLCAQAAADDEAARLGPRYTDYRHGFSLCPPAGAERERSPSATRLLSWRLRDPQTKAIACTVSVARAVESNAEIDLNAYARLIASALARKENFQVASADVTKVSGKGAMDLRGHTAGRLRFWQRQLWVQAEPGRFIILRVTGPWSRRESLETLSRRIVATLDVVDPKTAMARREEALDRGRKLLAGLTAEKVAAVLREEAYWLLARRGGKAVGFLKMTESRAKQDGVRGFEFRTWSRVAALPPAQETRARLVRFADAARKANRWSEMAWTGSGEPALSSHIEGILAGGSITCRLTRPDAKPPTRLRTTPIPPGNRSVFLPQGMEVLLPRLVDLKKKATYAFAVYNAAADGFDMRTFTVEGRETIELGGRKVEATRCLDRRAADVAADRLWVDGRGHLLRVETAGGLLLESASRGAVLKRFAKAEATVAGMSE
jgi:hypothetical protein